MQQHGRAHANRRAAHGRDERLGRVTDLPKKAKHRAVIVGRRMVYEILQVVAGSKHLALADDHHGTDGRRPRAPRSRRRRARAYISAVMAFFFCGRFNSIVSTPSSRVVRISMEWGTSMELLIQINETARP